MGFVAFDGYRLLVVCDGMGGHSGGHEASRMAVEAILAHVPEKLAEDGVEATLTGAIEQANQNLQAFAQENPGSKGMGTTAVMCLMKDGQVWLAHVGDSRAYLIRDGEVRLLTYDHTCINRLVLMGKVSYEDSIDHPIGHILERSVGVENRLQRAQRRGNLASKGRPALALLRRFQDSWSTTTSPPSVAQKGRSMSGWPR